MEDVGEKEAGQGRLGPDRGFRLLPHPAPGGVYDVDAEIVQLGSGALGHAALLVESLGRTDTLT
jgi:hypothetical protein